MKKIKVAHLIWVGGIGGTEQHTTALIKYFDPSQYEVHLCFVSQKGKIYEEARKQYSNVYFIGLRNGFDILGAIRLYRFLRGRSFDIIHIHTHNLLTNAVAFLLKRSKKVFHEHSSPGGTLLEDIRKKRLMYRLFSNSISKIAAISEAVKSVLINHMRVDPNKIDVVYNGVHIDKYNISKTEPAKDLFDMKKKNIKIIGFVGRLDYFKRPLLFIDIAKELYGRSNKFYFIMVGDGPQFSNCKIRVSQYGIENRFYLMGFRRDIPNILKMLDALIFTSKGEGFGNVVTEAMAMGVPVFAINDGAMPEIITDKQNGILLESEDPVLAAEKILGVLDERVLCEKISKQAVATIHSKFSMESCAEGFKRIYNTVLNK